MIDHRRRRVDIVHAELSASRRRNLNSISMDTTDEADRRETANQAGGRANGSWVTKQLPGEMVAAGDLSDASETFALEGDDEPVLIDEEPQSNHHHQQQHSASSHSPHQADSSSDRRTVHLGGSNFVNSFSRA